MYVMRDDERPLRFIQSVQGFPHLLFFLLFQQAVFWRFFFRRSPIIGEIGDDIRFDDVFLDAFQITLFPIAFIFKSVVYSCQQSPLYVVRLVGVSRVLCKSIQ